MATWKPPVFTLIIVVFFFLIIEGVLWAAGVRTLLSEHDPFQGFSEQVRVYQLDEARGLYRTLPSATARSFNYQEFKARKAANGFRLFVLGGSSAFGFPWGAHEAFTRFLGDALRVSWPGKAIEAVNAAAMSYGSHRMRILARELLDYDPDVLVLYEGHNEFVERRFHRELLERRREFDWLQRLLFRSRLYSFMSRGYGRILAASGRDQDRDAVGKTTSELLGIDVDRELPADVEAAERAQVQRLFEENLREIVDMARRAGVRVVLCTVPSNLSGWEPNQSFFSTEVSVDDRQAALGLLADAEAALEEGNAASAAAKLERARSLAPGYAKVNFKLGQAYEALGRWDEAREAYGNARDADGAPTRASSALNDTIRRVAGEKGAILVDVERAFEKASPHGVVGFNLIEDYVHPKPEGHRLIALELWKAFQERGLMGEPQPADDEVFWKAVGGQGGPATKADVQAELPASDAKTPELLFNMGVVLEHQNLLDKAIEKYRACLDLRPRYYIARYNIGRILHQRGQLAEAAVEYGKVLEVEPRHVKSLVGLGEVLRRLGRLDEAREAFTRATRTDGGSALAWNGLGGTLSQQNRQPEAEAALRRAVELAPKDAEFRANLGFVLLLQNKLAEAEAVFREILPKHPDHSRSRNGLAAVLIEERAFDEAERLFRESLRIDPGDSGARDGLVEIEKRRRGVTH